MLPRQTSRPLALLAACALAIAALGASCKSSHKPTSAPPKTPSIRLYVISTLAGALEPCGCVKDMLGGIQHAAGYVDGKSTDAPHSLVVGAGPMLFEDPHLDATSRVQDEYKAEALAASLHDMRMAAWAPGLNDWAAGAGKLAALARTAGAQLLAANLQGAKAGAAASTVKEVGGYKIGLAGVSAPAQAGQLPDGVKASDPAVALNKALAALDKQGVQVRVALVALPRGQALRLAERVKGLDVMVVGRPFDEGDGNNPPTPPVLVGGTLVVQGPNHLTGVAVVDLYVRGKSFDFQDGSGIEKAAVRQSLEERIAELERRISKWSKAGSTVKKFDLDARRADLAQMKQKLAHLGRTKTPDKGSFFRYQLVPVKESLGANKAVTARMDSYYRRVNEHNRVAFKDKTPPPIPEGESGYVGVDVCSSCHKAERKFWNTMAHAGAYAVLAKEHKQYNLDCVGCHVTGYNQPGGSTVTHVDKLQNVQCEVCHGPGSRHADNPANPDFIVKKPAKRLCADKCHHPPHVGKHWDVNEALTHIIGPGHGA